MTHPRLTLGLAASLLALAGSALAQTATPTPTPTPAPTRPSAPGAAATLPNTFDGPARNPAPSPPTAAPPTATPPTVAPETASPLSPSGASGVTEADIAEGALRAVISDLAAGRIEDALFTPDVATRMRAQLATIQPLLVGFGDVETIEPQGVANGASQFQVAFENAVTQWVIGLDAEGRIAALLFRPVPPVSSEPDAAEGEPPAIEPTPPAS